MKPHKVRSRGDQARDGQDLLAALSTRGCGGEGGESSNCYDQACRRRKRRIPTFSSVTLLYRQTPKGKRRERNGVERNGMRERKGERERGRETERDRQRERERERETHTRGDRERDR